MTSRDFACSDNFDSAAVIGDFHFDYESQISDSDTKPAHKQKKKWGTFQLFSTQDITKRSLKLFPQSSAVNRSSVAFSPYIVNDTISVCIEPCKKINK